MPGEGLSAQAWELLDSASSILRPESAERFKAFLLAWPSFTEDEPSVTFGDLESMHSDLWNAFGDWEAPPTADPRVALATTWWTVVNRQAHAAVVLSENRFSIDGVPNIRTAIEHALAVVWLSKNPSPASVQSVSVNWIEDLSRALSNSPDATKGKEDIRRLVGNMRDSDEIPPDDATARPGSFWWLVRELGVREEVYPYYPFLSGYCHPTIESTISLFRFGSGQISVSRSPIRRPGGGIPILWAVQCQCWAGVALHGMLEAGLPFIARLREIASLVELPLQDRLFGSEDPS